MRILSARKPSPAFRGVYTAIVTPFLPDGSVDWKGYERLIGEQLQARVHGVVPCGTTGESPTLSAEEKQALVERAVAICKGRAAVIAGTGSNDTTRAIEDSKRACAAGASALLVVTPYYNKPSQAGLEAHFRAIADESAVPVILYNVPSRTGVSIQPSTLARLASHPRIAGIKEASGSLALLAEMRAAVALARAGEETRAPFSFLSGDDVTFWPFLASGGDGVISVASNVLPNCMRALFEDWEEGRVGSGLALHEKLSPFFHSLFVESNPVPVKTLLSWRKTIGEKVRLPLAPLERGSEERLRAAWNALPAHLREDQPREDIHAG